MTGDERPLCECHGEPMGWQKDRRKKSGGDFYCAVKKREAGARYRAAHPGREAERARRYRAANPEAGRRWRAANPDKVREKNRRYRAAHPDKVREKNRRYRAAHPDKVRLKEQRRIRVRAGGLQFSYRVDPQKREKVKQQLADFKAKQQAEYREVFDGRVN